MKLRLAIKLILILFLFAGTSCEEIVSNHIFTMGREETFRMDRLYVSSDGQFTLLLKEISDSRCPEGLICIWPGEVTIKGEWTSHKSKSTFEIHSVVTQENKQPDGVTIRIVDAQPYPKYGVDSKPENLAVTLLIEKK